MRSYVHLRTLPTSFGRSGTCCPFSFEIAFARARPSTPLAYASFAQDDRARTNPLSCVRHMKVLLYAVFNDQEARDPRYRSRFTKRESVRVRSLKAEQYNLWVAVRSARCRTAAHVHAAHFATVLLDPNSNGIRKIISWPSTSCVNDVEDVALIFSTHFSLSAEANP